MQPAEYRPLSHTHIQQNSQGRQDSSTKLQVLQCKHMKGTPGKGLTLSEERDKNLVLKSVLGE